MEPSDSFPLSAAEGRLEFFFFRRFTMLKQWLRSLAANRSARRPCVPKKRIALFAKPSLEGLENRLAPAVLATYWTDADNNHSSSDAKNWSNGVPTATIRAVFDTTASGTGWHASNDAITWDKSTTVAGMTAQNGWNNSMTFNSGVTVATNANISINDVSKVQMSVSANAGVQLIEHAGVTVAANATLTLAHNDTSQVTFFSGDNNTGEVLQNSGTVQYNGISKFGFTDNIKIPVLNNGNFYISGGAVEPPDAGSTLVVSGSDALTNNVSWYQNSSSAQTILVNAGILSLQSGYTQTAGILMAADQMGEALTVYNTAGYGTVNINGGKVQVDPGAPAVGKLTINAQTVNLAGEMDVKVGLGTTLYDQILMNSVAGETLNCLAGSSLVISSFGQQGTQGQVGSVLQTNGFQNYSNLTIQVAPLVKYGKAGNSIVATWQ